MTDEPVPAADSPQTPPAGAPAPAAADAQAPGRGRRIGVRVLIWFTTLIAIIAILAIWSNRQLLNPDNWGSTSTQLLQNADVRDATANYLVEQLYANVDVEGELKSRLPSQLAPLSGPIAGGLRSLAVEAANRALANPKVQEIWRQANRAADESLVKVVEGGGSRVSVQNGEVSLNLATIVSNVTQRLGLPNVSSKLPASVARLKILKSDQLKLVQDGGNALKSLALLLTILVPLLYALAIALARGFRRRALMEVGIAAIVAGLVVVFARTILVNTAVSELAASESIKPAVRAVAEIATSKLAEIAVAFVVIGIPLIAAAWFAGPSRWARRGREAIAPFLREQAGWTYAIVAAIMLAIFIWDPIPATGKPAGIIVFLALAFFGTYLLRRQTAEEFPPAGGGGAAAA